MSFIERFRKLSVGAVYYQSVFVLMQSVVPRENHDMGKAWEIHTPTIARPVPPHFNLYQ